MIIRKTLMIRGKWWNGKRIKEPYRFAEPFEIEIPTRLGEYKQPLSLVRGIKRFHNLGFRSDVTLRC